MSYGENVRQMEHEYHILKAMESTSIPTHRVYGWDPKGTAFGVPAFLSDYIPGESLLSTVLAGEDWAVDLYLDSVVELQSLTRNDLVSAAGYLNESESAADVLETAREYLESHSNPMLSASYQRLVQTMPVLPEVRFSNGDLWLDNFIVNQHKLSGLIDFEQAGFSDVILPELTIDVIEYRSGNEPLFLPRKLPGMPRYGNLILKRGLIGALDLYEWVQQVKAGTPDAYRTVKVILMSEDRSNAAMVWKFSQAFPAHYEFSDLKADKSQVVVETLELAFHDMQME